MRVAARPILPTSINAYVSPHAFVPAPPPVNTVGTPSSPQYSSAYGIPRANPVGIFRSPFFGSGGNSGRPITQPAHPIARLGAGLFS